MRKAGVTGPPGSGKTSLWRAITGGAAGGDTGTVAVLDERLDRLAEMQTSRKRVPVQIQVVDVHASARTAAVAIARLREMDALLLVTAGFGGQDGEAALRSQVEELILADIGPFETRLGRARKDPATRAEVPPLEDALECLGEGRLLRDRAWEAPDLAVFSPLAPITLLPMVAVYNVDEDRTGWEPPEVFGLRSLAACLSLEAEVAGMAPEEAAALLEPYGIAAPVAGRVIEEIYAAFDLVTFYTGTGKESRAWEVPRGTSALEAAGAIHTDMRRGFIRAEVAPFAAIERAGSWEAAKAAGEVRVEGKDYLVEDGEVVWFRFSV